MKSKLNEEVNMFEDTKFNKFKDELKIEIDNLQYMIDRAYRTKEAGFQDLFEDDFNKLTRKRLVSTDGKDMWIEDFEYDKRIKEYKEKNPRSKNFYVYLATGIENEPLYIGKGSGDRYKHCNSGVSSSYLLNQYYFLNGVDSISVEIVKYFSNSEDALSFEADLIYELEPAFNLKVSG